MPRFANIPALSNLMQSVTHSKHTGWVSLSVALVLCVAVLWTAFFFIVVSGLIGAGAGIWLHYGQNRDNPVQVLRPVRGMKRIWIVLIVSGAGIAFSLSLFFSGLFTPDTRPFLSGLYMTAANGLFSFSAAFFTAGLLVIADARDRILASDAVQMHAWQQDARPIGFAFLLRSLRKA
ncbi:hypothetical protein [uncultured Roseobacter sp.]|uniref:hypothetical protein n=1 Tax=uncultured Roseobacter sp. TaxID=114847 RepID=UPI002608E4F1|nr:hypothetical protein [uncultured Roseobacter sp.]